MKRRKLKWTSADAIVITLAVVILALVFVMNIVSNGRAAANIETDLPVLETVQASPAPQLEATPNPEREPPSPPPEVPDETPDGSQSETMPEQTPEITPEPELTPYPVANISQAYPEISASLDEIAEKYNCVGVTLAYLDTGAGYLTYQHGQADIDAQRAVEAETKFRVASLSKVVVMMLAMTLVEDGVLDLDEDISAYLGYDVRNPNYPDAAITSRMLIQHTSSIYDSETFSSTSISSSANTLQNLLAARAVYRNRNPGETHEYSDLGYIVLGAVCEKVSGKLLDTLAKDKIFAPLGIDAAFVSANLNEKNVASQYGANHAVRRSAAEQLQAGASSAFQYQFAVGNLTITALDFAKLLRVLVNGGTYDGVKILSSETVREIHNANVTGDRGYMQALSVRLVADGFFDEAVYYHTGSAYGTLAQFFYSLDSGKIVVVVTTGANSERGAFNSVDVCTEMSEIVWMR